MTVINTTNYMPKKIISGGQTGVDRGALDACIFKEFNCGGWCPKGRLAEDGIIDNKYPLTETKDKNYDTRTKYNVERSDGTLIISPRELSGGTLLTWQIAKGLNKSVFVFRPDFNTTDTYTDKIINWLIKENINILNIAGPRKSEWKQGYQISYLLILDLIDRIEKFVPI